MMPALTPTQWAHFLSNGTVTDESGEAGLPCRDCGMLVSPPDGPVEVLTATERERAFPVSGGAPYVRVETIQPFEVQVTQCARCRTRNAAAADLVDDYPSLARSLGDRWYATLAFEAMLLVPEVAGMDWRSVVKGGQKSVRTAMRHFRPLGGTARWSSAITPTIRHDAHKPTGARWRHVSNDVIESFRKAYGEMLADLTDGPRLVGPPEGTEFRTAMRGCLLCGVGAVSAMRNQVEYVWGPLRAADSGLLGGRRRPDDLYGYLCPRCSHAVASIGPGIGPTGMEKALFAFLEVQPPVLPAGHTPKFGQTTVQLENLRAWCTLPTGTGPNVTPWAHVPDLGTLARGLREASAIR
ncbi:hypothetical protein [Curtobacterium sp. VKM Ac-1395]|uniref:hypothetical protein n=1 Tax=Curtobacterium sp. VKM Ac-1395 TaxID=2783815 RepID=UPI00188A3427|nr:hypothetical protein [Curtobacterium sp. VKM Ac-1395]MBF4591267.1 hypothetical protein [Curtobacterium sp. VKM Ac-1395]